MAQAASQERHEYLGPLSSSHSTEAWCVSCADTEDSFVLSLLNSLLHTNPKVHVGPCVMQEHISSNDRVVVAQEKWSYISSNVRTQVCSCHCVYVHIWRYLSCGFVFRGCGDIQCSSSLCFYELSCAVSSSDLTFRTTPVSICEMKSSPLTSDIFTFCFVLLFECSENLFICFCTLTCCSDSF